MKAFLAILIISLSGVSLIFADDIRIVGNPNYIHLLKDDGVWWFVDHMGKRFITTGMNHVDEGKILFNEVNEGWLQKEYGDDIKAPWVR
ncbi:MAG: hypothetical protein ACJZ9L_01040 [Coraliomargaritaceae bacterium]